MAEARSGFSVEWIVRCLCSLNLLRPGFLLPVTGGTHGGSPSLTSKQLILRSPKLHTEMYSSFPISLYNLIDTMT